MSFADDLKRFAVLAEERTMAVHEGVTDLAHQSIVYGSAVTGAPGQPVAPGRNPNAGKLRDSWTKESPEPGVSVISTPVDYAPDVEDNPRGVHFSNHGPHSVKLTLAAGQRMVDDAARRIAE